MQEACIAGGIERRASLPLPWPREVGEFPSHSGWWPRGEGPALPGSGGSARAGSSSPLRSDLELLWEDFRAASAWFSTGRAKVGLVWEKLVRVRHVWSRFLSQQSLEQK